MEQVAAKPWVQGWAKFLVAQRVTISLFVFSSLIFKDLLTGTRPHDTANWHDPLAVSGLLLVLAGLAIRSWAAGVIRKKKVLATTGPYRLCRHPLYLGSLLMMLGFCTIIANVLDALVVFGPVLAIYWLTMHREERKLAERHGTAWSQYVATAPRLVPLRPFTDWRTEWSLVQWRANREYNAVVTTLAALAALHFWRTL